MPGRCTTWSVATRLLLARGLPQRNLLYQLLNLRVGDAPDLHFSLPSPSVDGDNLLGEQEANIISSCLLFSTTRVQLAVEFPQWNPWESDIKKLYEEDWLGREAQVMECV